MGQGRRPATTLAISQQPPTAVALNRRRVRSIPLCPYLPYPADILGESLHGHGHRSVMAIPEALATTHASQPQHLARTPLPQPVLNSSEQYIIKVQSGGFCLHLTTTLASERRSCAHEPVNCAALAVRLVQPSPLARHITGRIEDT